MIPATTLLEREDLRDRLERGQVKAIVTDAGLAGRFAGLPGAPLRIAVGRGVQGWVGYDRSHAAVAQFAAQAPTRAEICCSCTSPPAPPHKPKLVAHTHVSYPVGHLSTMYWLGLKPGDVHLNLSSPAGRSTPGRASSRPGMRRRPFWRISTSVSRRGHCLSSWCVVA